MGDWWWSVVIGVVASQATGSALLSWQPKELGWLGIHYSNGVHGVISGLVLAQCLYYYRVMRLLPASLKHESTGYSWRMSGSISALLAACFLYGYIDAYELYAVATAFHAWLL